MKHTGSWQLDVGIPLNGFPFGDKKDMVSAIELGEKSDSSGTGFGYRDLQILFKSEDEADEAEEKVIAFLGERKIKIGKEDKDAYISVSSFFDENCKCEDCEDYKEYWKEKK